MRDRQADLQEYIKQHAIATKKVDETWNAYLHWATRYATELSKYAKKEMETAYRFYGRAVNGKLKYYFLIGDEKRKIFEDANEIT